MVYVHALAKVWRELCSTWCGYFLPAGNEMPAGAGEAGTSGILSVLELCQRTGDIPELLFLQRKSHCLWRMELELRNMTKKDVWSPWNMKKFYLVTVYTPNSQSELRRLEYRMHWKRIFWHTCWNCRKVSLWSAAGISMWHIRRSISRTRRPTAKMQALRMKREPALPELLRVALLIHSAIFIRIKRVFTPGGPTVSVHERRTPAGVSTISLFPFPERKAFRIAKIHGEIMDPIIARLSWILICDGSGETDFHGFQ